MFYVGIDITKNKQEASIIHINGKLLRDSISFYNTKEGCGKLLALLDRFNFPKDDVIIGMEATGHHWLHSRNIMLENYIIMIRA